MKLRDTLNMPNTSFAMKGNLAQNEPKYQAQWLEAEIYQKVLAKNEGKKPFYLHDGPPYANGNIHTGHVLNKVLKDFIIRSKNMNGYYAPIIFGWDTHGLPIENAMLKNLKKRAEDFDPLILRQECHKYALKQVKNQKEEFFSLGLLADPNEDYLTLYHYYEKAQIEIFNSFVKQNLIYQGLKPVYWSWSSKTALAEAEVEYKDIKSPAIYVSFDLVDDPNTKIVIWTTTPWTLPANMGVSVGSEISYSYLNYQGINYIVATNLIDDFCQKVGFNNITITKEVKGNELEYQKVINPLNGKTYIIMLGDHVSDDSGSGCVHTAPAHGEDDFIVGNKYHLEILPIVDDNGYLNENSGEFAGIFYDDANKIICEKLASTNHLLKLDFIKHSYPHDWRSKKPIIFRATKQWFCNILPIKDNILKAIEETQFASKWGKIRLHNMLENRNEWCISRQRKWGVPIPIFYAEDESPIIDPIIIQHVANLFGEHGSDIWFSWDVQDLLPQGYTNAKSPHNIFTKEMDIMDVWFDSGSSFYAVLNKYYGIDQADLYLEGSDQYRGWFNSSLITSVSLNNKAPYKQLVSHGFVLDGKGNKMSKSLGNVIEPSSITKDRGADILRLWVASVDYQNDVNLTNTLLTQVSEIYRKYRNTIRFMLGNLDDFNSQNLLDFEQLEAVDQFILIKLNELTHKVINRYEEYDFTHIIDDIVNYITNLLSGFYLDFIKDIIYVSSKDALRRRQIQSVLYYNVEQLLLLMHPIIPHTTYEAYKHFKNENICLQDFKTYDKWKNDSLITLYEQFLLLRNDINKEMDLKRKEEILNPHSGKMEKVIGSALKAKVIINPTTDCLNVINQIKDIKTLCIIGELVIDPNLTTGNEYHSGIIKIEPLEKVECQRCRQYFDQDQLHLYHFENEDATICSNCLEIVNNWSNNE